MMSPRISIVDDDASVRSALEWLCLTAGYEVKTYDSAEDFLEAAELGETECLILDVNLPGQSGLQLQRKLRAAENCLPIVFITAFDNEQMRIEALEAGAVEFLSKPLDSEQLLAVIKKALG